jgi:hypothetical protein
MMTCGPVLLCLPAHTRERQSHPTTCFMIDAMWQDFWKWFGALPPSSASFLGTLTGSSLGLIALLLGALFNAHLNRKRDDRLRRKETRALAAALRAELVGRSQSLLDNATRFKEGVKSECFIVPDIAQSIRVMPNVTDKLGLLDEDTIKDVIDAYVVIEQYCDRLILSGGRLMDDMPGNRRSVLLDADLAPKVLGGTLGVNDVIQKAIKRLDAYCH